MNRLEHLLIDRATVGLSAGEQRELKNLAGGAGANVVPEDFDLAAAAVELACGGGESSFDSHLPHHLRAELGRTARELFG